MKRIILLTLLLSALLSALLPAQQIPHGVILTWMWSGTGTPTYSVYRATAAGKETQPPLAKGLTSATYTDTSAVVGQQYFFTVTATVGGVESAPSPEVSAQITVPSSPSSPGTAVY